jgi:hypothetical protein
MVCFKTVILVVSFLHKPYLLDIRINIIRRIIRGSKMKVKVCECPKNLCRFRWIPRVEYVPKECPNCKHRFSADWGLPIKCTEVTVQSREDLLKLRADIREWNDKLRWKSE